MKEKYLLDSNILIHHQRGYFNIGEYLREHDIPIEDCYISEITAIEVKVGEILLKRKGYKFNVDSDAILSNFNILPISDCIDFFVKEKCRLQFAGTPMANNFDLLIGCTAVVNNLIMVTENIKDFKNIETIRIENWISR
jgi:tRNA(fMet)-specific endonuclease VapC